jgi:hypothetical protein
MDLNLSIDRPNSINCYAVLKNTRLSGNLATMRKAFIASTCTSTYPPVFSGYVVIFITIRMFYFTYMPKQTIGNATKVDKIGFIIWELFYYTLIPYAWNLT